jgi:potassium-transporting ATPase potassium-binding subunit
LAFNIAVSFMTGTSWQSYPGEMTLSHLSQMLGIAVQSFTSAATALTFLPALAPIAEHLAMSAGVTFP